MNQELIRIVDNIARDKNIDKESIFQDLEAAMVSAARKFFGLQHGTEGDIVVHIDRATGDITAFKDDVQIDVRQLGRIPAQTAKQVMIQKIKADERDSIYAEYAQRKGEIVNGIAGRYEERSPRRQPQQSGRSHMPKSEQISGETHHPNERIRCMILEVPRYVQPGQDYLVSHSSGLHPSAFRAGSPRSRRRNHRNQVLGT